MTERPELSQRTTLGLGGRAMAEVRLESEADLDSLSRLIEEQGGSPMVLGKGSNLLLADRDHELVLVTIGKQAGSGALTLGRSAKERRTVVRAGAGLFMPGLLGRLASMGLSGLEPLAGIPGTVGGAVAMNAGSYGTETADAMTRVRLWSPKQGLFDWLERGFFTAGYRTFAPAWPAVSTWSGRRSSLAMDEPAAVRDRMKRTYASKKATQPVTAKTCGCVFKNPPGDSAGRLLDRAGFRGRGEGNMEFSPMHANFLVNRGGGTASQAMELIRSARRACPRNFPSNWKPKWGSSNEQSMTAGNGVPPWSRRTGGPDPQQPQKRRPNAATVPAQSLKGLTSLGQAFGGFVGYCSWP